jgi:hypothetical protein
MVGLVAGEELSLEVVGEHAFPQLLVTGYGAGFRFASAYGR